MKTNIFFLAILASFMFVACEVETSDTDEIDMEAVRAEIQALEDAYAEASNAKDAEGVAAYYADDAQRMPPGEPMIKGKDAILSDIKEEMAGDTTDGSVRFEVLDIWAEGDLAVEVGASIETTADGEEHRGKYVSIFEKRDGKYVCIRDIWNSDADDDEDMEEEGEMENE